MKISINALFIPKQSTGIGYYTANLIKNIEKIDRENTYVFHVKKGRINERGATTFTNIRYQEWSTLLPRWFLREGIGLIGSYDLLHCCNYHLPKIIKGRSVVTIHDITFLIHPEAFKEKGRLRDTLLLRDAIKRASLLICDSHNTKKDIMERCGVDEDRLRVVHLGVDSSFYRKQSPEAIHSIKKKYGIAGDYLLIVASLGYIKNHVSLIKAFAQVKKQTGDIQLVIAGGDRGMGEQIRSLVTEHRVEKDVLFLEYVGLEDLPALYSGARIFIFPSWYEGFGLPVLEAMACGCPVIASKTSSLPEVVGEAGLLIDPKDDEEIGCQIQTVLTSQNIAEELSEKSFQRSKLFSWEKTARETIEVYQALV